MVTERVVQNGFPERKKTMEFTILTTHQTTILVGISWIVDGITRIPFQSGFEMMKTLQIHLTELDGVGLAERTELLIKVIEEVSQLCRQMGLLTEFAAGPEDLTDFAWSQDIQTCLAQPFPSGNRFFLRFVDPTRPVKPLREFRFISVARKTDPTAVVSATVTAHPDTSGATISERLDQAVCAWLVETDQGRAAWKKHLGNFTFGLLANYANDPLFQEKLRQWGIVSFSPETLSNVILRDFDQTFEPRIPGSGSGRKFLDEG